MKNTSEEYHTIKVSHEQSGKRFDQALTESLQKYSRSLIKKWIEKGNGLLNGTIAKPNSKVSEGDIITLEAILEQHKDLHPQEVEFKLVDTSETYIVLDKPAGVVVHPGSGNRDMTLVNGLISKFPELSVLPRAGLIHRIDKDTSGLLLVARTVEAYHCLNQQMQNRQIGRTYQAIVNGVLVAGETINQPIGRHQIKRIKMQVNRRGKEAITHFRVREKFRKHSLLELQLATGRTHQIRVHLAWKGYPIVGDKLYGWRPISPQNPDPSLKELIDSFPRQALHAKKLSFFEPESKKLIELRSEAPNDFQNLLIQLRRDLSRS